ncbi:Phosphoadenosine phosphosulfate reductase [Cytospora mali]|uniref:phosphoadenylyl-sulfate reductase (thioredoxin) n=1 Tax=Cytospora mali TaxID=578113 RepID=A0A194VL83_CYTMA|nr:Phosphoadenosine phosphosulfate reductase [Valsa mali]
MGAYDHSSAEASPHLRFLDTKSDTRSSSIDDTESGYASATSSTMTLPAVTFTPYHLKWLNNQLENMHPMDILRFCKVLFPNLYQSTAFGLTGLVTLDMMAKLQEEDGRPVDIIFLDTLYHFQETHDLVDRVRAKYPKTKFHIFKPDGCDTTADFEATYGEKLWEVSSEMYDWYAKVEPQQRAYTELNVAAVLTGRRRSQGGVRGEIPVIEVDEESGVVKINPVVNWTFAQVQSYIKENGVPYNSLLDKGYKSVGDWHSTSPVKAGEDERAGRWKGQDKTECGIHNKKSRYAQFLADMERKQKEEQLVNAFQENKKRKVDSAPATVQVSS